ncbi:MAG TPA: hypothetical protein P5228_07155 [Bacteroidales bacterium]|nr:hypothetical protein [Bacteroidales bacterium]HRZ48624.1 hypothetical protein [Bacteroidales bacterium]
MLFYTNTTQQREPVQPQGFSDRFKRFLKTQPVLAVLLAQAVILYITLHTSFFYGLTMVIILYFGGLFLRQYHSDRTLLTTYLAGALTGYLLYPLMFTGSLNALSPLHLAAIQGSAVMALLAYTAVSQPGLRMRVFLLMSVRYSHIALLMMIIVVMTRDLAGGGTHLVYIGGALASALLAWITVRRMSGFPLGRIRQLFHPRQRQKFTRYKTVNEQGNRPMRDEEYNDIRAERQQKIDEILEKISRSGYDSLTKAEKELLFQQSKP